MAQFLVRHNDLSSQVGNLHKVSDQFLFCEVSLNSIADAIDTQDSSMVAMVKNLRSCTKKITDTNIATSKLGETIKNINEIYLDAEKGVYSKIENFSAPSNNGLLSWLWDSTKKAGYLGSTLAFIESLTNGVKNKDTVTLTKTAYSAWKSMKSLSKDIKNMGMAKRILHPDTIKASWAKKIFGGTDYFNKATGVASQASSWSTRFYNNFQKAGVKEISKVSWASVAVSGIFNAISNKGEYDRGEISASRAVAETVVETAVDITVDIVVTSAVAAAVGATAVALGATVAAPSVVVAAGVIGVKMGLDAVAKWATGGEKGFTEAVSDGIIDGAVAIGKGVSKAAEKVGDGISQFAKSITTKWKPAFGF